MANGDLPGGAPEVGLEELILTGTCCARGLAMSEGEGRLLKETRRWKLGRRFWLTVSELRD